MRADEDSLRALVYGGAVLGGGGGGSLAAGLRSVREALATGRPRMVALDALPPAALLATLSAVGSAGETSGSALANSHFRRALELLESFIQQRVDGFIASEVGPRAVTYGLQESARTGTPVVDAPANGRAHPLFLMGSFGLHRRPTFASATAAVGGRLGGENYLEIAMRANVAKAARAVRGHAARSRMALAVARNPVPASFIRKHAAVGALASAREIGSVLLAELPRGSTRVLRALSKVTEGGAIARGVVANASLSERNGFTIGSIRVHSSDGSELDVPVCNEFMSVLANGRPIVSFPDLISLFDLESGLPLGSAEVVPNRSVSVFVIPRNRLMLGSTMRDRSLLRQVEQLIGVRLAA